jgi:DNA polymerase III delta prime subunit|tara:strand:- start:2210 stop:3154 length:945 start_codon:yes stop_codon:yes gene_type:complete
MKDYLWVEKYRPQKIEDCILVAELKQTFLDIVQGGELPNMLFSGTAGLGKTTVAKALCSSLGLDHIIVNGSEEGNIDTLRGKIKQFASSVSLSGDVKVVILDEADYLNPQSTQPALRGFIEEFSDNCRFILTCNFKNRIIEPLHSRCGVYEFNSSKPQMMELCGQFLGRATQILTLEGIPTNNNTKKALAELIMKHAPDWRRVLNECQRGSMGGALVLKESVTSNSSNYDSLFLYLKNKDFKKMRSWVVNNMDVDVAAIFRAIYDRMYDKVQPHSIPQLVLILADYQYKNAFVADHELNVVACLTEIMADVEVT